MQLRNIGSTSAIHIQMCDCVDLAIIIVIITRMFVYMRSSSVGDLFVRSDVSFRSRTHYCKLEMLLFEMFFFTVDNVPGS